MIMELEDVISILNEMLHNKTTIALRPQELVHEQYMNLGIVEGVKCSIRKLEEHARRESYQL